MVFQHSHGNLLDLGNRFIKPDDQREFQALVWMGGVVDDVALVDGRIRHLHMVAIGRHQHRRAGRHALNKPFDTADLNQIAGAERILRTQEDTCQKVLGNVTKGDPQRDPGQSGSAKHGQRNAGQAGDVEHTVESGDEHKHTGASGKHVT